MDGFWAENVELGETNWDPQLKNVNGLQYRTAVIKKQVLFPQRPGKLKLAPFTMECVVNRSFFNRGTAVEVRSNAAELTVTALPPNAPAAWSRGARSSRPPASTSARASASTGCPSTSPATA